MDVTVMLVTNYAFFYKKYFYDKMKLKNPETLRKCWENLQPQMPELQFLKALIFPRVLGKLQNSVNVRFFSDLKFFSAFIIKKMAFIVSVKTN